MTREITKEVLNAFRQDFKASMKELENKYGFVIELNRITYNEREFTGKMSARLDSVGRFDKYERTFNELHSYYGLQKDWLHREFNAGGRRIKLVGLDTKKRTYPCICADVASPSTYKLSVDQVKTGLLSEVLETL